MGRPKSDLENSAFYPEVIPAVVSSGGTTSAEVDLDGAHLVGIGMPSSLTSTSMSFQVASASGGTYKDLYDQYGTKLSITIAASHVIYLDPTIFAGFRFIKLVTGSSEGADRSFNLYKRAV